MAKKATRKAVKKSGRSVKRPKRRASSTKRAGKKRAAAPKKKRAAARKMSAKPARRSKASTNPAAGKTPRLDRVRRTLEETVPTPPSSLNMERRASAARSGRAEMAQTAEEHRGMPQDLSAGDVDVNVEDAYFTGDEAPGGDNQTPDQDVVDDIGRALGVRYDDADELRSTDKISDRDKHRWEMDPASSEDYKERK